MGADRETIERLEALLAVRAHDIDGVRIDVEREALPGAIRLEPTAPPAASAVAEAIEALEFTRWQPTGDLAAWSKTDDGRNHARVMHAIGLLRGIVATPPTAPGERGEAVEALLREAEGLSRDYSLGNYVPHPHPFRLASRLADALRETTARAERLEAESDALRNAVVAPCDRCGHGKSADWKALEARAERSESLAAENATLRHELNTLRQRDASKSRAELHAEYDYVVRKLTAEREAHEETRRKLEAEQRAHGLTASRLCEVRNGVIEALDIPGNENGGVSNERIISAAIEAARKLATLEAAPDLGEAFVEECAQAAYSAHFGNAPMKVGDTRPAWRAGARAVLEMAAKRWGRAAALGEAREGEEAASECPVDVHDLGWDDPTCGVGSHKVAYANGSGTCEVADGHEVSLMARTVVWLVDEVSRLRGRR